jgi:hypothetical protein
MSPTIKKHLAAIEAGQVTKSNVIGIRKALNAAERARYGYGNGATSPRVDPQGNDTSELLRAIRRHEPEVTGALHESGLKVLRSPRWRKRWTEREAAIIERLYRFSLVRFDFIGRDGLHAVPVYRAIASTGQSFLFRNIPWQSALYMHEESGPVAVGENK